MSLKMIRLEYARALSVGDKEKADALKAQGDAMVKAKQPPEQSFNSGTFQAVPGFFTQDTGTLPNGTGRF
jgi:hypothetical protein